MDSVYNVNGESIRKKTIEKKRLAEQAAMLRTADEKENEGKELKKLNPKVLLYNLKILQKAKVCLELLISYSDKRFFNTPDFVFVLPDFFD